MRGAYSICRCELAVEIANIVQETSICRKRRLCDENRHSICWVDKSRHNIYKKRILRWYYYPKIGKSLRRLRRLMKREFCQQGSCTKRFKELTPKQRRRFGVYVYCCILGKANCWLCRKLFLHLCCIIVIIILNVWVCKGSAQLI